jgi:hypothetical protein
LSRLLAALSRISGVRLPPASSACCDRLKEKVFHLLSVHKRLVALDVTRPE